MYTTTVYIKPRFFEIERFMEFSHCFLPRTIKLSTLFLHCNISHYEMIRFYCTPQYIVREAPQEYCLMARGGLFYCTSQKPVLEVQITEDVDIYHKMRLFSLHVAVSCPGSSRNSTVLLSRSIFLWLHFVAFCSGSSNRDIAYIIRWTALLHIAVSRPGSSNNLRCWFIISQDELFYCTSQYPASGA